MGKKRSRNGEGVLGGGGDLDEGEDEILAVGWEDEIILGARLLLVLVAKDV